MADSEYRGARIRELPRANRTYPGGRVCAAEGCTTKLSIYNKWDFCWQHEPVHTYISRGKRRSSKKWRQARPPNSSLPREAGRKPPRPDARVS